MITNGGLASAARAEECPMGNCPCCLERMCVTIEDPSLWNTPQMINPYWWPRLDESRGAPWSRFIKAECRIHAPTAGDRANCSMRWQEMPLRPTPPGFRPGGYYVWDGDGWNTAWDTDAYLRRDPPTHEDSEGLMRRMLKDPLSPKWLAGRAAGFIVRPLDCGQCGSTLWGKDRPRRVNPGAARRDRATHTYFIMVTCQGDPNADASSCGVSTCYAKCCALIALNFTPRGLNINMLGPYCGGSCKLPGRNELHNRITLENEYANNPLELQPYRYVPWMRMQNRRLFNFGPHGTHESGTVCSDS